METSTNIQTPTTTTTTTTAITTTTTITTTDRPVVARKQTATIIIIVRPDRSRTAAAAAIQIVRNPFSRRRRRRPKTCFCLPRGNRTKGPLEIHTKTLTPRPRTDRQARIRYRCKPTATIQTATTKSRYPASLTRYSTAIRPITRPSS